MGNPSLPLFSVLTTCAPFAIAADQRVPVVFPGGQASVVMKGAVKGYDGAEYLLSSAAGGRWAITLQATGSTNFNITAPGADSALFMGEIKGRSFEGTLPVAGEYRVVVYQMRSDARRGKTSSFTISFRPLAGHVASPGESGPPTFNSKGNTRCGAGSGSLNLQCAFRVARMPGGRAEIWLDRPGAKGMTRVLLFSQGEFTSNDKATVNVRKDQDTWLVTVDGREVYMIPEAMIQGG